MKHLYIITGGTLVHISPHFALCAPAYGLVGAALYTRLNRAIKTRGPACQIYLIKTRMAGRNAPATLRHLRALGLPTTPETNHDLQTLVSGLVAQPETAGLVLAAAICDFEPETLTATDKTGATTIRTAFGKNQLRLHHLQALQLTLRPSAKIIDAVKKNRPDICLVTFKTTAGVTEAETFAQALDNLRRSQSDWVLANDIQHHHNLVVTPTGEKFQGRDRAATLALLCQALLDKIIAAPTLPTTAHPNESSPWP